MSVLLLHGLGNPVHDCDGRGRAEYGVQHAVRMLNLSLSSSDGVGVSSETFSMKIGDVSLFCSVCYTRFQSCTYKKGVLEWSLVLMHLLVDGRTACRLCDAS